MKTFTEFVNESTFMRLPKDVIGNDLYSVTNQLKSVYDSLNAGNDFKEQEFDAVIKRLQEIKKQAKKFKDNKEIIGTIYEGYISELHIMAQEAKDFNDFDKAVKKEYPKIAKDKNVETWLKSIYEDAMNESMLTEGKISFDKMTFTVTTSSSNRGMILQFIPDSKTLDFPKQEQADAIMQRLSKKSPELAKLMWYDSRSYSAGISFAIDQYAFAEYIEKILK
jgi:hypothetical protein